MTAISSRDRLGPAQSAVSKAEASELERFLSETVKGVDGVERTEKLIALSSAKETWKVSLPDA